MIKVFALFLFCVLGLTACQPKQITPEGKYSLKNGYAEYSLEIKTGKTYSLRISSQGKTESISGTWEWDDKNAGVISLSGIVWHGTTATGEAGFWRAKLEGGDGSRICLDAEGITCFEKAAGM
ncbi:hypothetical protein JCM19000A_05580 [Silvimonas sp. JCM 19000]